MTDCRQRGRGSVLRVLEACTRIDLYLLCLSSTSESCWIQDKQMQHLFHFSGGLRSNPMQSWMKSFLAVQKDIEDLEQLGTCIG